MSWFGQRPALEDIFVQLSDTDSSAPTSAAASPKEFRKPKAKPTIEEDEADEEATILFTNIENGITETRDGHAKDMAEEDMEQDFHDNILSAGTLRSITGNPDLHSVTTIELQINTEGQSLDDIGVRLPNLIELNLTGSFITSIRDIGMQSLRNLTKLTIASCGLTDLDGLEYLTSLQELYASGNHIEDLSPLMMHESVKVIDLSRNEIKGIESAEFLESIPRLVSLRLEGNALCHLKFYRNVVCSRIPLLCVLDGIQVTDTDRERVTDEQEAEIDDVAKRHSDEQRSVKSSLHEFSWAALATQDTRPGSPGRPGTPGRQSSSAPSTSYGRPSTPGEYPLDAGASQSPRPGTARPGTARPQTGRPASAPDDVSNVNPEDLEGASELSYGGDVLCGSFIKSRRRKPDKEKKKRVKEKDKRRVKKSSLPPRSPKPSLALDIAATMGAVASIALDSPSSVSSVASISSIARESSPSPELDTPKKLVKEGSVVFGDAKILAEARAKAKLKREERARAETGSKGKERPPKADGKENGRDTPTRRKRLNSGGRQKARPPPTPPPDGAASPSARSRPPPGSAPPGTPTGSAVAAARARAFRSREKA